MLALRHQAALAARAHLYGQSFLEIETPILVKPTPEGARDYVVPSRVHPGKFYALPQSPQLYKQTLMIAGSDRYFQFARCMRDEDLRADRQPEHTQIDLEMSFVREDDVFAVVEGLMVALWRECLGVTLATPFPRLTYREAMLRLRLGQARPALRPRVRRRHRDLRPVAAPRRRRGRRGRGRHRCGDRLPGGAGISGTQLRKYEDVVKEAGGGGLTFFKVQAADREKQQVIFPGGLLDEFLAEVGAQDGDAVLFTYGPWETPQGARRPAHAARPAGSGKRGLAGKRAPSRSGVSLGARVPAVRVGRRESAGRPSTTCSRCRTPSISSTSRAIRARCTRSSTTSC